MVHFLLETLLHFDTNSGSRPTPLSPLVSHLLPITRYPYPLLTVRRPTRAVGTQISYDPEYDPEM